MTDSPASSSGSATSDPGFDVEAFVQGRPLGSAQLAIVALIALIMAVDGYDLFLMGNIIPAIADDWRVAPQGFAALLAVQQTVLGLGGFALAPLADRFGRKAMMVVCLVGIALTSSLAAAAPSLEVLIAARGGAALFMAGVLPNAVTLVSEHAPARSKATCVMLVFMGFSLGGVAGSYFGTLLTADWGWRAPLALGAILPLLLAVAAAFLLPESIVFLALRDARDRRIPRLLRRLASDLPLTGHERFTVTIPERSHVPVAALFGRRLIRVTLLLWGIYALTMIHVGLVSAWMPTILVRNLGITLPQAGQFSAMMGLASIVGMIFFGRLMDRLGAVPVIAGGQVLGGIAWMLLPAVSWTGASHILLTVLIGLSSMSAQSGLSALASSLYPASGRATGLGWAVGFGRTVALASPFIGAALVAGDLGLGAAIGIIAAPLFIAGPLVLLLSRR